VAVRKLPGRPTLQGPEETDAQPGLLGDVPDWISTEGRRVLTQIERVVIVSRCVQRRPRPPRLQIPQFCGGVVMAGGQRLAARQQRGKVRLRALRDEVVDHAPRDLIEFIQNYGAVLAGHRLLPQRLLITENY